MGKVIIWKGRDNVEKLTLKEDGTAYASMDAFSKMLLDFRQNGSTIATISSDNGDSDPIKWNKDGYANGEVRLDLGGESIDAGSYDVYLRVYYTGHTSGDIWKYTKNREAIPMEVIE